MTSLGSYLATIRAMNWPQRGLLVEAVVLIGLTTVAIRVLPFRVLMRLAEWPLGRQRGRIPRDVLLPWVRRAVLAASRRAPWDAVCLHQSLTAQILLRRRGAPSVLYYGAHPGDAGGMKAHAWVKCDGVDVVGGEVAGDYAVLATFPRSGGDAEKLHSSCGT